MLDRVLEEVEEQGREERIPMLGPDKARLLASCVEKAQPSLIAVALKGGVFTPLFL